MFEKNGFNRLAITLFILVWLQSILADNSEPWKYSDLKGLDKWGDCPVEYADLVAVYGRRTSGGLEFRADLMDIQQGTQDQLCFAIDYADGGRRNYSTQFPALEGDLKWDFLIRFSLDGSYALLDTQFQTIENRILSAGLDTKLDFASVEIDSSLFNNPNGIWQIQVVTLNKDGNSLLDKSKVFTSLDSTGRGKLVLTVSNVFTGYGPHAVSWYDGFGIRSFERQGERRGFRYLLDAFERHEVPMVIGDLRIETLPANEYLPVHQRIRELAQKALCEPLSTLTYGHFMCWQPEDVDTKAMKIMARLRGNLNLPASEVFFPYESMITAGDIKAIADAGYSAIYGLDQYRYWFGWLDDWSNMEVIRADIESLRKIHRINGVDFLFNTQIGNYQGFAADERWEIIDWGAWSEYGMYEGTDEGLYTWWRRILLDMAMHPDQEQFFTVGTDLLLTPWLYPDVIEWNVAWVAAHPWIETVTFGDILNRGWTVIDHGDLGLNDDELLIRYPLEGDMHYNAYFPWFYHGGVSDGHSPHIPAGESIEAYSEHIPFLRQSEKIPSGKAMGDEDTPGTLINETLAQLRAAPDNAVTDLAWLAWFLAIAEQTFHAQTDYTGGVEPGNDWGGQFLHPAARLRANYVNQVNKLTAAAVWADTAATGVFADTAQIREHDFDLDGENEWLLFNNEVWCLFENDGGRLEYAFSYSESEGPVQLVAPTHQHQLIFEGLGRNYELGETSALPTWDRAVDGCFVENFTYPVYTTVVQDNHLIFTSPDASVEKTFTLDGFRLSADYRLNGISQVNPGFGFTVNLMNTYNPDWHTLYQEIEEETRYGWSCSTGGTVTVDLSDPNTALMARDAFSDSPADEELQERISYDDYPNGHWFNFPYHTISTIGVSDFRITLSLKADTTASGVAALRNSDQESALSACPNPFNPSTTITFFLSRSQEVSLIVFNLLGERVRRLKDSETMNPGSQSLIWNGRDQRGRTLPSGIYILRLDTQEKRENIRILLLR